MDVAKNVRFWRWKQTSYKGKKWGLRLSMATLKNEVKNELDNNRYRGRLSLAVKSTLSSLL